MHTIRKFIIDFIFISILFCSYGLQAIESETKLFDITSKEMCIDEMFQMQTNIDQSVLRVIYEENGVEVKHEVIVTSLGEAYILKDNSHIVKTLSYVSGDVFSAELKPDVLEIKQNNALVFSQHVSSSVVYQSSSAIIEDNLHPITFDFIDGYCEDNGAYSKCEPSGWGNAGFVSKNVLKQSEDGYIKWTVQDVIKYRMIGLGDHNTTMHYQDIDYAAYQARHYFAIYESGKVMAKGITVAIGDEIMIKKEANKIKYFINNQLIYTSTVTVSDDLYILNSGHTRGALVHNAKASFTEDYQLYTTASVTKYSNRIKWNSLKHYEYDPVYQCIVSTDRISSALSENFYQADLGHKPISVIPNLSKLFTPKNVNRDISVVVGVKQFEPGNYLESEISFDRMFCGFVFERSRGNHKVYLFKEGNVVSELNGFDATNKHRITIDGTRLNLEREEKGRYMLLLSYSIEGGKKYNVYQGTNVEKAPFIDVNVEGFEPANSINYAYHYDGIDNLLETHNGDVKEVLTSTGQGDVLHHIGWHNLTNVKGYNSNTTVREGVSQDDDQATAYGESAFNFNPKDEFKISFIYSGGDYSIGSKTILSAPSNPFLSGFNISGGSISLVNNGTLSNSTSIASGANVAMVFNGNNTMTLQVNGSVVGSPISLPSSAINLGMSLNQGSLPAAITAGSPTPPPAAAPMAFVPSTSAIVQDNYNITCNGANATFHLSTGTVVANPNLSIEIIDITTSVVVSNFQMTVNTNSTYSQIIPNILNIGIYGYQINGQFQGLFEVLAPAEWDDNTSSPYVNDIFFDVGAYNTNSQSLLYPIGPNARSISNNLVLLPQTFSVRIPVNGSPTVVDFVDPSGSSHMVYTINPVGGGGVQVNNQNTGNTFVVNGSGDIILDFINTGGTNYDEVVSFIPSGNPFGRILCWSDNIQISTAELQVFLQQITSDVINAAMTFCNTTTTPSIVDEELIFESCGYEGVGNEADIKDGYDPNTYSCPIFSVKFKINNLKPSTLYRIHQNMYHFNPATSNFDEVYQGAGVLLGTWWCNDLDFNTDVNGLSTTFVTLNDITSEQLFGNDLFIKVKDDLGVESYVQLDFSVEDESVIEVYRSCFNYDVENYDCLLTDFGSIDNRRNYTLAQPTSGFGEIDYEWTYTNQPVNGGLGNDLETGCYTVTINHEGGCGLPPKTLQYKMMARADWLTSSSSVDYLTNPAFNGDQYNESKMILSGIGEIRSLNYAPIEYSSIIRYRHLYTDESRDIGFYLEGTASNDFAVLAHITEADPITGLSDVSLQLKENGVLQPLIATPLKLEKYQHLDLKIADSSIPNKLQILLIQYPEFGMYPGDADELAFWTKNDIDIPANGGEGYQAFVKHYDINAKTPNLSVNFCVEPVESYTALLQRSLHDGRHQVVRCITEPGNPNCPIPINGSCDPSLELDLLYFKFDEDYYRDITNVELLDFEIRDYKNELLLSSADNLPNSIVQIGDNRYALSMATLSSMHPYYTLIVKNAKNEKRYLRFKK